MRVSLHEGDTLQMMDLPLEILNEFLQSPNISLHTSNLLGRGDEALVVVADLPLELDLRQTLHRRNEHKAIWRYEVDLPLSSADPGSEPLLLALCDPEGRQTHTAEHRSHLIQMPERSRRPDYWTPRYCHR